MLEEAVEADRINPRFGSCAGPISEELRRRAQRCRTSLIDDERHAKIIEAIREIPEGFVRTYGDVSPGAPRLSARLLSTEQVPDDTAVVARRPC